MNENIEKVLAVLDGFRMSDEMTYSAYSILHDEISMLDDLLKAHVMTPEEVADQPEGTVVWMEQHTEERDYISAIVCSGKGRIGNYGIGINLEDLDAKDIRFWTSRPTDEQREATTWS